jgi:glycerophosphoryl diester phosphodiesterase
MREASGHMQPPLSRRGPIAFAHRGGTGPHRENTLDAFVNATRLGATAIETDVWLTNDGIPVLDHDGVIRARPPLALYEIVVAGAVEEQIEILQASLIDRLLDSRVRMAGCDVLADRAVAVKDALDTERRDHVLVVLTTKLQPRVPRIASLMVARATASSTGISSFTTRRYSSSSCW